MSSSWTYLYSSYQITSCIRGRRPCEDLEKRRKVASPSHKASRSTDSGVDGIMAPRSPQQYTWPHWLLVLKKHIIGMRASESPDIRNNQLGFLYLSRSFMMLRCSACKFPLERKLLEAPAIKRLTPEVKNRDELSDTLRLIT